MRWSQADERLQTLQTNSARMYQAQKIRVCLWRSAGFKLRMKQ